MGSGSADCLGIGLYVGSEDCLGIGLYVGCGSANWLVIGLNVSSVM